MRKAIFAIFASLLFLTPVYAQEMQVKEVRDISGTKEAVIEDRQTGEVWTVREGDAVREWTVVEITETLVTLEQMTDPDL